MKPTTAMYIGAAILFVISACLIGIGGFIFLGSLDPINGQPEWGTLGGGLMCIGSLIIVGAIVMTVLAIRKTKQETAQNVTLQVDLPGQTKIEQVKCQSCGGVLSAKDITMANGAPMVHCPYCSTVYQMTEEPKW